MCCHCLLIEGHDRLILVDTGLGVEDVTEPERLGLLFRAMLRPKLEVAETALRQVADLGFRPSDVRHIVPTHLDLDHAGGIADFPGAAVHVHADELRAASSPSSFIERTRYRAKQIAAIRKWDAIETGGDAWLGFSAVRAMPGTRDEVLLVPLPGHTRGHCGVAVRRSDDWLLHCGDAYFHHSELAPDGGRGAERLRRCAFSRASTSGQRLANHARLREWRGPPGARSSLVRSHDFAEFAAMRTARREARGQEARAEAQVLLSDPRSAQPSRRRPSRATSGGGAIERAFRPAEPCGPPPVSPRRRSCPQRLDRASSRLFVDAARVAARVGRVARRGFARTCAFSMRSVSRARASSRLRGWLAKLWAKMTITPSWVARAPASLMSRVATSSGRLGLRRASNRSRPRSPPC